MTGEREVKMAAGLYAMRDTARQVLGSKYTAKMAELGAVLKAVGEKSGREPLAVAIDAANGATAMEQCCLLAAAVELAEPTLDPGWRRCEFCGCETNARLRACCGKGRNADRKTPNGELSRREAVGSNDGLGVCPIDATTVGAPMHTAPMADSQGEFAEFKVQPEIACRKCGVHAVSMREWESSCGGYEDHQYRCNSCGHTWWVEGPDA